MRRFWLTCFFVALSLLSSFASGIQQTASGFLISGTNFAITVSATNGSILSVTSSGQPTSALVSGEYGLWLVTNEAGASFDAAQFSATSTSNKFTTALDSSSNVLILNYSNAAIVVTINISNRSDGIDLSGALQPQSQTALEFDLPARLRFSPTNLIRLVAPLNSSDGDGAQFNPSFFAAQPASDPASWTNSLYGETGYVSLYGASLTFVPDGDPQAPISFTTTGVTWLGTNLQAEYSGSSAWVNRPPAAGQADLTFLTSTNGAYFSASHLGGKGLIFRLGGEIDDTTTNVAQDAIMAAIEHLAQATHTATRTNIALLNLTHGPASGGWAAVPVTTWSDRLSADAILAQSGIQIIQIADVQTMLDDLTSNTFLAILNPYGEWTPSIAAGGINRSVTAIGVYVKNGGNWFETGGNSFYYALLPDLYYSYGAPYPPAFADFLQIETPSANVSLYGVQPDIFPAFAGSNNVAAIFVPGRIAWGGDSLGGYCERAFGTFVAPDQTWISPTVRLTVGYATPTALSNYAQANAYSRTLAEKMSPTVLNQFINSLLIYYNGDCSEKSAYASLLPSPALVHFADYLMGGFDHEYPDDLPPNAAFGTSAQFTNFLAQAHRLGLLTMPYTNPTWFPNDPPGPTFVNSGGAPLLRNLDGSLSYEVYPPNYGYTITQWHPVVETANEKVVNEFSTNYPVDFLFEDQCGARTWEYDLNPYSPTPYAYSSGIASRVAADSATFPLSTEDGWDRLINHESQFCGMAWATIPTANPPSWQIFLRDRFATSTWDLYPVAQFLAHDKVSFILHDLGQFVTDNEVLAWNLGLGYGLSDYINAPDLTQPATSQWLFWLDRVQKSIVSQYVGQPINSFAHSWSANGSDHDNGFIQSSFGQVNILANLSPQPLITNGVTLAPYGFYATPPGVVAGNLISDSQTNGLSFVIQTNGNSAQFWLYTPGEQSASVPLPSIFDGPATLQLDGHSNTAVTVQNASVSVPLGMTPTQDRTEPPSSLAGLAPVNWPGPKPSIGVIDFPGFPSAWTTNTPSDWLQAFRNSSLATTYNLPIVAITNLSQLTLALQAGPTNFFAIVNPNGEIFPESTSGDWPATLSLIQSYVNNGGSWWEVAGYTFYSAAWLESGDWQTEVVGPSGMETIDIPVGGGANNQPAEPLNVTPLGQTIFGLTLSAQLQGLETSVNRGLLPVAEGDPGHIALLSGAQQDFLGGYRFSGWGYFWRFGGFYPNASVELPAAPAVMTYLYTNQPLPALASSVNYFWHGTLVFPSYPTIQANLASGLISFQITGCPANSVNYIQRALSLDNPSWQTIFTFTTSATNYTDPNSTLPTAFYRILSVPSP